MATLNFSIPEIIVGQAQKEVTHNEALAYIDALLKNPIIGENSTVPPVAPVDGEMYTLGVGATGVWAGQDGNVAIIINAIWYFVVPFNGLIFYSTISNNFISYDSTLLTWSTITVAATSIWGNITGTLANQADLVAALALKEDSVGNPTVDGQVLSSTIAGVRSWITSTAGAATWGAVTGVLSAQTDLQAALDLKATAASVALKEADLGTPAANGMVLSSTISGVRSWIATPAGSQAWGTITGTLSAQTDLQAALDAKATTTALALKESGLGAPAANGMILSSTIAGVRSWINNVAASLTWGSITGTLANQTDLQAALTAKETALGNPAANGMILSSTSAGVRSWTTPAAGGGAGASNLVIAQTTINKALGPGIAPMIFEISDSDLNGLYNVTTGQYTVPTTGYYSIRIELTILFAVGATPNQGLLFFLYVNDAANVFLRAHEISQRLLSIPSNPNMIKTFNAEKLVFLTAGERLNFQIGGADVIGAMNITNTVPGMWSNHMNNLIIKQVA